MAQLNPCPFCGSNEISPHTGNRFWVACLTCWAEGPSADTQAEAAERWNQRYAEPVANAVMQTNPGGEAKISNVKITYQRIVDETTE